MTTIIMISNNSSVIINNSNEDEDVGENKTAVASKASSAASAVERAALAKAAQQQNSNHNSNNQNISNNNNRSNSKITSPRPSQSSPVSSSNSSISSFSPTPIKKCKNKSMTSIIANGNGNSNGHGDVSSVSPVSATKMQLSKMTNKMSKNSLSTLESEDSDLFNQSSSAASTLSSTGNSSSTSGIANSITYFPSLDEEESNIMETSTPANKHHLRFFVNPKQYNTRSLDRRKLRGHSSGSSSGKSSLVTINDNDILREKSETKNQPNPATPIMMETVMQPTMANYCTLRRRSSDLIKNKTKIEYISNVRLDFPSGSSGSSGRGHSNSSTSSSSTSSIKTDQPLQVSTTKSPTATSSTMQAGTTAATTKEHASELLPDQTNSDGLQDPAAAPSPQREQHRVRKLVKSAELQASLQEPSQSSIQSLPEVVKSIHASIEEQSTTKCSQMNNKNAETTTDYTSDDDDLSHAEELSSFNEDSSSSTSNESLNSGGAGNLNVLPTGWHRHPHIHQVPAPSLGPVDEIIDDGAVEEDEDDDEDEDGLAEHIYSSVVKPPRGNPAASATSAVGGLIEAANITGANRKPRFTSVLRSSRIMRRHTTYYNAKQFDSLPPQGTNSSMIMSTSSSSASSCQRKPHVHSWHHRHRHHEKHSISNSNSSPNNSNNNSLHQVGPGISILELSGGAGMIFF